MDTALSRKNGLLQNKNRQVMQKNLAGNQLVSCLF